jgi:pyruvate dehydrogenase kinase 2/3/4
MQTLPYVVVTNPHISAVYELYYKAFDAFRRVKEIKTVEDNDRYCDVIKRRFSEHLTVIPRLATGILECQDLMNRDAMDQFMNVMLRSVSAQRHGFVSMLTYIAYFAPSHR